MGGDSRGDIGMGGRDEMRGSRYGGRGKDRGYWGEGEAERENGGWRKNILGSYAGRTGYPLFFWGGDHGNELRGNQCFKV